MGTTNHVIGAVLPERRAASTTAALERAGLTEHDIVPTPDGVPDDAVSRTADRRLAGGLLRGAGAGAVPVAVGMAILAVLISPSDARAVATITAAVAGGIAGGFLGGYLGMSRHRRRLWHQRDFEQTTIAPDEVLVVVDTSADPARAEDILLRHGGRLVKPAHPDDD